MTAEIDDIRELWERLAVCNVCSKHWRSAMCAASAFKAVEK